MRGGSQIRPTYYFPVQCIPPSTAARAAAQSVFHQHLSEVALPLGKSVGGGADQLLCLLQYGC